MGKSPFSYGEGRDFPTVNVVANAFDQAATLIVITAHVDRNGQLRCAPKTGQVAKL